MRENSNGIQIAANTKTKSEEGVEEEGRGVEREAREREREREKRFYTSERSEHLSVDTACRPIAFESQ